MYCSKYSRKMSTGVITDIAAGGLAAVAAVIALAVWLAAGGRGDGCLVAAAAGAIAGGENSDGIGDVFWENVSQAPPCSVSDVAREELRMFNAAYNTCDAIAAGLLQGVQLLQSSVNYSNGLTMRKNSGDESLIVHTSVTERETASESSRSYQEYDEHGNLLHEYVSVRETLGRNADGTAIYGESTERYIATYSNTYDTYGNLIKQESYGWFGSDSTRWEYVYTDGRMMEKREYSYGLKITQYDEKGRIIAYTAAGWTDYWFYGKSEEEITEFVNTNLFTGEDEKSGTLHICDENGAVLREEYYKGSFCENIRYVTDRYAYDERGNCIALRTSEDDETLGEGWYYDEADRLITHTSDYGSGGTIYTETYSYNAQGKVESVLRDYDNSYYVDSETLYYYDAEGNLVRTESTEYCEYDALEFSGIDAIYYDGSRWIVALETTEYTIHMIDFSS